MPEHPVVTIAARRWDHLWPLAAGAVETPGLELRVDMLDGLPDLMRTDRYDAAEISLSRYALGRAAGDDALVGIPVFPMRGFRHRCILVPRTSVLESLQQLRGCTIGVTGWADTGNTWTRALVRRAGVELDSIEWRVGPLTRRAAPGERLGPVRRPPNVAETDPGTALVDELLDGRLDAIMTPFMPPGFHDTDAPLRHLITDYQAAEATYYREVGFCPGIHAVALRRSVVEHWPWLPGAVYAALEQSKQIWLRDRRKLADVTPWTLSEIDTTERLLGPDWMPYGRRRNERMVAAFCAELVAQNLSEQLVDPTSLFPTEDDPAAATAKESA